MMCAVFIYMFCFLGERIILNHRPSFTLRVSGGKGPCLGGARFHAILRVLLRLRSLSPVVNHSTETHRLPFHGVPT